MAAIGPQIRIRDLRKAHNLSIPALVERIRAHGVKVHADHISNIELGYRRGSDKLMAAWAKALDIDPLDVTQPSAAASEDAA